MKRPHWDTGDGFDHKLYDPMYVKAGEFVAGLIGSIVIILLSGI